jgi:hypothetical protein
MVARLARRGTRDITQQRYASGRSVMSGASRFSDNGVASKCVEGEAKEANVESVEAKRV